MNPLTSTSSKRVIVRMAEWVASGDPSLELATNSLGSCIAVTLYDPVARVGGLLHTLLPNSTIDPKKAARLPGLFIDTGFPNFFQEVLKAGAKEDRIEVKIAGGADMVASSPTFNVGERNYKALSEYCRNHNLRIAGEAVRGHISRLLRLNLSNGMVRIESPGQEPINL